MESLENKPIDYFKLKKKLNLKNALSDEDLDLEYGSTHQLRPSSKQSRIFRLRFVNNVFSFQLLKF